MGQKMIDCCQNGFNGIASFVHGGGKSEFLFTSKLCEILVIQQK